jgi:hypothetical protein
VAPVKVVRAGNLRFDHTLEKSRSSIDASSSNWN